MFSSISINERDFMMEALESKFRVDARGPNDLRKINVKFGSNTVQNQNNKNGQVMVQMGHTKILTQTQLKLCTPTASKPQEGFIKYNVEFDSLNHMAEFSNQTQTLQEMRIEVQNFIEKITRSSRATDKEGLCIISGKLVWSVTVSLHLLNDDGNSFDAFFLAAILALKNTRLPEVSMTRDKLKINDGKLKYVNVHHIPISTTFYFMKDIPDTPIIDVNSKEERLCTSRLSIVMNAYEDICGMCTLGALNLASNTQVDEDSEDEGMAVTNPLHSAALFECMQVALEKTKEITAVVRSSWDMKDKQFTLLDIGEQPARGVKTRRHQKKPAEFMQQLNDEVEMNRLSHPSQQDDIEMNQAEAEELQEQQLMDMVRENGVRKKQQQEASEANSPDAGNRGPRGARGQPASNQGQQRNAQQVNNNSGTPNTDAEEQQRDEETSRNNRRSKLRKLQEIEQQGESQLDLRSALKKRRDKK